ncbi:hypothetical protein HYH02_013975 [Chlamydomonas schloesseri]|uniref:DUF676 domain-containing protein n=1 Tax=Chlamydomonas schloesseri TaxID=2026947 RepID=A0A835VXQ1_9CHLO|nr:hypothetical protein HYH02_013975 [Chlamydomonas schloesseri]|eukprot:KAG2429718.1 hypothetical protein HYH02_013975 [Chlamydomonas schloesseri]
MARLNSLDGWFRTDESASGVHLFVCQHGLWGSPSDTAYLAAYLRHQGHAVLNAAANTARCTFDGADVCGDRLAAEVVAALQQLAAAGRPATSLSFAAYSFGGLIARYAAGKLLAAGLLRAGGSGGGGANSNPGPQEHAGMEGVGAEAGAGPLWPTRSPPAALVAAGSGLRPLRAANFLTIASPHLGCWEEPSSLTHQAYNSILPVTLSRTGRQLLLADCWLDPQPPQQLQQQVPVAGGTGLMPAAGAAKGHMSGGPGLPLLAVMADPGCVFHAALALFDKRVLLADIRLDRTVPYCTAAIARHNPYSSSSSSCCSCPGGGSRANASQAQQGAASGRGPTSRACRQPAAWPAAHARCETHGAAGSDVGQGPAARRRLSLVQEEDSHKGVAVVVGSLEGQPGLSTVFVAPTWEDGVEAEHLLVPAVAVAAAPALEGGGEADDDTGPPASGAAAAGGLLAAALAATTSGLAGWVPPLLRCVPGWSLATGFAAALVELAAGGGSALGSGSGSGWAGALLAAAGGMPVAGLVGSLLSSSSSSGSSTARVAVKAACYSGTDGRGSAQHTGCSRGCAGGGDGGGATPCGSGISCICCRGSQAKAGATLARSMSLADPVANSSSAAAAGSGHSGSSSTRLRSGGRAAVGGGGGCCGGGGGMLALPISSAYPCIVTPHPPPPSLVARRQQQQPQPQPHRRPPSPLGISEPAVKAPANTCSCASAATSASSQDRAVVTAAAAAAPGDGSASASDTCDTTSGGKPGFEQEDAGAQQQQQQQQQQLGALRRAHSSPSRSGWAAAAARGRRGGLWGEAAGSSTGGSSGAEGVGSGGGGGGWRVCRPTYGSDGHRSEVEAPYSAEANAWGSWPSYAAAAGAGVYGGGGNLFGGRLSLGSSSGGVRGSGRGGSSASGGSGGISSPRLRLGLFLALLPVLLALWGCMVAWLVGCWLHHVALLLAVRPDRSWDVRLLGTTEAATPATATASLPASDKPPRVPGCGPAAEQRQLGGVDLQQPQQVASLAADGATQGAVAAPHADGGGGSSAPATQAQELQGPTAVVRAVVAAAVRNVLLRHGVEPKQPVAAGADMAGCGCTGRPAVAAPCAAGPVQQAAATGPPGGGGGGPAAEAGGGAASAAATCTCAAPAPAPAPAPAAADSAATAPRDTAALLDDMITHLNLLSWQKVDVDTGHYAAHAAIVVRSSRRFARSHGHIIEYALRQLRP